MTRRRTSRARLTFRARLTLAFTGLVALAGVAIVVAVAVFMRVVPTYQSSPMVEEVVYSMATTPAATPDPSAATGGMASRSTGLTLRSASDILDTTLAVSLIVLFVLIAAGALVAWLLAGRMLRPLQAVNAAAQRAGTGSFDHRIGLTGPRDEVRDLADTFDDMLARLDRSFAASQRFAANASHELQTPLAATQTMLEVTLADPNAEAADLRAVAARVLEMNRRSTETVAALLDLAELDERTVPLHPVDLAAAARGASDDESAEIAARGLTVVDDLPSSMIAVGDAVLVRQALSNLLRNAVRHNVDGGTVTLRAAEVGDQRVVTVENTGAVLDDELVASFVEPFVRGAGRIAGERGHGLGLALVDSVMRAHGGELRVRARSAAEGGGLRVDVAFPAGADADPATA